MIIDVYFKRTAFEQALRSAAVVNVPIFGKVAPEVVIGSQFDGLLRNDQCKINPST